ncbi:hypothetical protein [Saccharopolyspora spinosa]|uniref:Uncharacterized protein n=1 Tax=Saccharopolyspora spinosa TaxID=60894 RepID=A0A2N3Y7T7_SACSN|nr:hypothetical protein [Saccharopolyspora spinosa]PKW19007.1 hypothetical protein A8926_7147 [Saccharopolyspora spinosa]
MNGARYGLRVLALVGIVVLGVAAGIWWSWPKDTSPQRHQAPELSSRQLAELLPAAGVGRFRSREDALDRNSFLAAVQDCAPVPAIQQFRTTSTAGFASYVLDRDTPVQVAVVRVDRERVAQVQDALSSAGNCHHPADGGEQAWTKIARPWFGDVSALFTTTDVTPGEQDVYAIGGPVWTFTMSDEWLVAVGAYTAPLETVAEIYPPLLERFDREVGTHFLRPGESRGGCRPANLVIHDLPPGALSDQAVMALQGMHDMACQDRADEVRSLMSTPLVVDDGSTDDGTSVDIGDPGEIARILETRGVYRNGAVQYRLGDSALVFSTLSSPGAKFLTWDAYVRDCATAMPSAARMCGPDPYGPLGGADWRQVLAERGCDPDPGLPKPVQHAQFQDFTGDGRPDAVLVVSCSLTGDAQLNAVQVYDGGSPPESPRLIQELLGGDPGPEGRGLLPVAVMLGGDDLTAESWSWRESDDYYRPSLFVIDQFRWQGGTFAPMSREVQEVP